ncbi:MAG TPA: prepilin-type N-terminal cleavage/methylation domain-containing protein [Candidatus Saccharimonadales bacterium]|nr:prepilin-type N-terminal cleavage/methylation domain-containing protein [Candidatus Saccharimonadales bacterium]
MKRLLSKKGSSGFTIIEVTIVLAIAGLIMAIVFVAVPALERNSRNTQRRADASHLAGLISEYAANHAGQLPTGYGTGAGNVDISGEHWSIVSTPTTINTSTASQNYGSTSTLVINEGQTCDPGTDTISTTNASTRSFAVGFQVEGSGGAQNSCISD